MFSIKRQEKLKMNFTGSPQCGNAGDMKFTISVEGFGETLDSDGFVFDSALLFELFTELRKGRWSGSCEAIGVYCCQWLFRATPWLRRVTVTVTTESTNVLTISLNADELYDVRILALKRIEENGGIE